MQDIFIHLFISIETHYNRFLPSFIFLGGLILKNSKLQAPHAGLRKTLTQCTPKPAPGGASFRPTIFNFCLAGWKIYALTCGLLTHQLKKEVQMHFGVAFY